MNADHLAKKLIGMQLLIEPVALTLFHIVRKLKLEPVLSELLPYYERDEARHIALGIQYLPAMLTQMSPAERILFEEEEARKGMWAAFEGGAGYRPGSGKGGAGGFISGEQRARMRNEEEERRRAFDEQEERRAMRGLDKVVRKDVLDERASADRRGLCAQSRR